MLILNRPGFKIKLNASDSQIEYAAEAVINIELSPTDMFGVTPLNGKLAFSPVGATLSIDKNRFRGAGRITSSGHYPMMNFQSTFLMEIFSIYGNVAKFVKSVKSLDELYEFIQKLEGLFPALFSGLLPAPVDIISISGTLQGYKFEAFGNMPRSNSTYCTSKELEIKEYFDKFGPRDLLPITPVVAALRYLQQADRLEYSGHHTTTFLPERILNLAKSLESLFPGQNGVDCMRQLLTRWAVKTEYIDVFATLKYLRNQVDVGHVSFTDLAPGVVSEIHSFVEQASRYLRCLLSSLLRNRVAQDEIASLRKNDTSSKPPDAIRYLKKYKNLPDPENNDLTKFSTRNHSGGDVGAWIHCVITESAVEEK